MGLTNRQMAAISIALAAIAVAVICASAIHAQQGTSYDYPEPDLPAIPAETADVSSFP